MNNGQVVLLPSVIVLGGILATVVAGAFRKYLIVLLVQLLVLVSSAWLMFVFIQVGDALHSAILSFEYAVVLVIGLQYGGVVEIKVVALTRQRPQQPAEV